MERNIACRPELAPVPAEIVEDISAVLEAVHNIGERTRVRQP